jgi:hypothetical protein
MPCSLQGAAFPLKSVTLARSALTTKVTACGAGNEED